MALKILAYALVLTVGPILFISRILFGGRRAILTVPLCLIVAGAAIMFVLTREQDTDLYASDEPARAPATAAARPAPSSDDAAIQGVVVTTEQDLIVVAIRRDDRPDPTTVRLRLCGAQIPDAPAQRAPQGEVIITPLEREPDNNVRVLLHDAHNPNAKYLAATRRCSQERHGA